MVELPQGVVIEVRRGGHDALKQLAGDMSRLNVSGHIRIERKPKELMPRISQVIIQDGMPKIAIHESDAIKMGLEALLEIESDATAIDALISLHELSEEELDKVIRLYPDANIYSQEQNESSDDGQWWNQVKLQSRRWARDNRLPEMEATVDAPEFIRQKTQAQLRKLEGNTRQLNLGDVILFDADDSSLLVELSGALAGHGRPIQIITRTHPTILNRAHDIPVSSCLWLSTSDEEGAISSDLENLRRKILNFLWANKQAIVAIDGLEYLSSRNDDSALMDFIRSIADEVRMEDHALLLSCDLSSFESKTRHSITREVEELSTNIVDLWLMEDESLFEHPICRDVSEEESMWIQQQLNLHASRTGDLIHSSSVELVGGSPIIEQEDVISAGENLAQVVDQWSEESRQVPQISPIQEVFEEASKEFIVKSYQDEKYGDNSLDDVLDDNDSSVIPEHSNQSLSEIELIDEPAPKVSIKIKSPVPRSPIRMKRRKVRKSKKHNDSVHISKSRISAAVKNNAELTDIGNLESYKARKLGISDNLAEYSQRQDNAFNKTFKENDQSSDKSLIQASMQKAAKKNPSIKSMKSERKHQQLAVILDKNQDTSLNPLMARGVKVDTKVSKFSRESATRKQTITTVDEHYQEWTKGENTAKSSGKLFDEKGKELKKVTGDRQ
tara:strand:+ start:8220 stop:10235 length:2016 start_codon:yes stop_codon:yes gene_type:complete